MSEKEFNNALVDYSSDELAMLLSMNHSRPSASLKLSLLSNKRTHYSQGKTGTCWLSSALLCISLYLKNTKGIEITENSTFSKSYLLFYDKIERTELFLSLIDSNFEDEQRMRYLLNHLITDRGQWNMAKNLIIKYGLIPYKAMPDPFHQKSSVDINVSINNLLKLYAVHLKNGLTTTEKAEMKNSIMKTVIIVLNLFYFLLQLLRFSCSLILVLPYENKSVEQNRNIFLNLYDEIEICSASADAYYKSAFQIRNQNMIDRSALVLCCIEHESGGAYQAVLYAGRQQCGIINLAEKQMQT